MGTPANLEALAALGVERRRAAPADVVIAVDGADGRRRRGLAEAERAAAPAAPAAPTATAGRARPRTLAGARLDGANVALISVPGEYAALEAHRALTRGLHVFLFSDHVARRRRGRAQAPRRASAACSSWARAAAPRCSAASGSASPTSCAPGRSGSSPRPAPARRRSRACSTPPASACRRSSASAGATCRRRSAGIDVPPGHARCWPPTRRPRRCCWCPSRRTARRRRARPTRCPAGKRVVAAFVGWEGERPASRSTRRWRPRALRRRRRRRAPDDDLEVAARARRRVLGLFSGGSLAHEACVVLEPLVGVGGHRARGGRRRRPRGPRPRRRRSTPRAARTRWSTSACACELLEAAAGDGRGCVLLDVVSATARTPTPRASSPARSRALAAGATVVAHVCGTDADPQDAGAPGGDAARRRASSSRRPTRPPRGWRRGRSREDRDAHLLGAPARRRRARALGRRALAARGHEVELFALGAPGDGLLPHAAACRRTWSRHVAARRAVRRAHLRADRRLHRRPARAAARRRLRRRPRPGLHLGQRGARRCATRASSTPCVRTVHHVDDFRSPSLVACQERSIVAPDRVLVRLDAVGRAAARRVRRRGRAASPTASTPSASARRATPASAPPRATRPASTASWPCSRSAASSRARDR